MSKLNPDFRNFLKGALGYSAGAVTGVLFIFITARLGLVSWLFSLIDENQVLVKVLGIPRLRRADARTGRGCFGRCGRLVPGFHPWRFAQTASGDRQRA